MATITGNRVYSDPTQWFTLDYTFANATFTWSVTAHCESSSVRNNIYGLTVNIGGNSYYKGDIAWGNYTPNTVVYSGTTSLANCTVSNGVVNLSVQGNFWYGTWNTTYRSSGSGTCAVDPPTVATLSYTATNKYNSIVVASRSKITFTMKGTSNTGASTINYVLYQGSTQVGTASGNSGANATITLTAPNAGTYSYKYTATDSNGTVATSGTISITTQAYTPPSFTSVNAVRWTTANSSGSASDTGTYAKCTANFTVGKIGSTNLTTTWRAVVNSRAGTSTTNGGSLYLGAGTLSADSSWTVTFQLYDAYSESVSIARIVRTDTLSIGGRGIDLIMSNGSYGVGVGAKANAGYFDMGLIPRYLGDEFFYKSGDQISIPATAVYSGYITTTSTDVYLSVPVSKLLTKIPSTATYSVTSFNAVFRGVSGYVGGNSYIDYGADTTNYTVTCVKQSDTCLRLTIRNISGAFSNATNNTPIAAAVNRVRITITV